jgi:hypothetical protein
MVARVVRRLPGFQFKAESPQLIESLPRMDVAVFVGFAASGPLHTPVAVEDAAQFAAVFGEDAPLVWDARRGEQINAYLGPAVRAFFDNGGRRCFVVRVAASQARSNCFPLPGLVVARWTPGAPEMNPPNAVNLSPAFAQARSEGSWSDGLRTSTVLLTRPVQTLGLKEEKGRLVLDLAQITSKDLAPGDLLRLSFDDEGYVLMLAAETVEQLRTPAPPGQTITRVVSSRAVWFKSRLLDSPPSGVTQAKARLFVREVVPAELSDAAFSAAAFASNEIDAFLDLSAIQNQSQITLDLATPFADAPDPGSLIGVEVANEQLWMTVAEVSVSEKSTPASERVTLKGQGLWSVKTPPATLPTDLSSAEVLTFELWVKQGDEYATQLGELGFAPNHPRFWAALPTDEALYDGLNEVFAEGRAEQGFEKERVELWRLKNTSARFPLAGIIAKNALYIPIGMQAIPEHYLKPIELSDLALERDGLAKFDATLFFDTDLKRETTRTLMGQADFLRYLSPRPRKLKGIYAALSVEEATLIAVPDAIHRGWFKKPEEQPVEAEVSLPPVRPEWWHFLDCNPPAQIPRASKPETAYFLNCDIQVVPVPVLSVEKAVGGTFTLSWQTSLANAKYTLEEATYPNFSDAEEIYTGTEQHLNLYGREPGDYYYRVRALVDKAVSDWSNGVVVRVSANRSYQLKPEAGYSSADLLAVQRALLRMCAARADLFAVLTLPEHYREDQAIEHAEILKLTPERIAGTAEVQPLGYDEANDFSYASLYHPWLVGREDRLPNPIRQRPPDGAACGVIAARALARGAWIAPANEALRNVVALTPAVPRDAWLKLQEAQINLIRQEPRGFLALSADTLSTDEDLRPIGVRRLLILLRRLAFRLGARYVFEPNDDAFRRLVERGFEAMLGDMFMRGAFAGKTPATAFQVVTSTSLNTPQSVEQGRFIVELKVAPSLPMTFLTIRLVQTGDKTTVTEGR